ncbi:MAG TPA: lamin tail domain-containing protein [bacterium]|nr:lamin tail domain-containing protein [bacterium]HPL95669.1 lamin tail domain-containing protein [bacterium]
MILKKFIKNFLFLAALFGCGFLFSQPVTAAVVINEIMYNPESTDSGKEWVELYNNSESEVDLVNYVLEWGGDDFDYGSLNLSGIIGAKKYFLIGGSEVNDVWSVAPDLIDDELEMQNGGTASDGIRLFDGASYYDTVLYDEPNSNNLAGDEASPGAELCPNVADNHSLSRKTAGVDNNLASDWEDLSTPTPHNSSYEEAGEENNNGNNNGQVVINELLPNPAGDDETEWIELKNLDINPINLDGWVVSDLSGHEYKISKNDLATTTIAVNGFLLLAKTITGISLNNTGGETARLFNPDKILIYEVSYIEAADENMAWARDENNLWHWTTTLTPEADNVITAPVVNTAPSSGGSSSYVAIKYYPTQIIINELMPNPIGSDLGTGEKIKPFDFNNNLEDVLGEWIELKSKESAIYSLEGWKISNGRQSYTIKASDFKSLEIGPDNFFILPRYVTGLTLKNSEGDEIKLYDPSEHLVDSLKYNSKAAEGETWMRDKIGKIDWTVTPTPKAENVYTKKNLSPKAFFEISGEKKAGAEIVLDASEAVDPEGELLNYFWTFKPGVNFYGTNTTTVATSSAVIKIKLEKIGKTKIELKVVDNEKQSDSVTQEITVLMRELEQTNWSQVIINEIMPNPKGADELEEWVEIFNQSEREIDLTGWSLDDEEGGSRPYLLDNIVAPARGFVVLKRALTKIAFNNTNDAARLLNPLGELMQETDYDEVAEGQSYMRDENGEWFWTSQPTPNQVNVKRAANKITTASASGLAGDYQAVTLEEARELPAGTKVIVEGVVSVLPGVLGVNIFYVAGSGLQIYCYKKDFPDLKIGERIRIVGTLSEYYGEKRLKINNSQDIKKINQEAGPEPEEIVLGDVLEEKVGSLVKVTGEVTAIKKDLFYLDDGQGEIKVVIKSGTKINLGELGIAVGDRLRVVGILSLTSSGERLLPRYEEDLEKLVVLGEKINKETDGGEINWLKGWKNYVLVLFLALIIFLGLKLWLIKRDLPKNSEYDKLK